MVFKAWPGPSSPEAGGPAPHPLGWAGFRNEPSGACLRALVLEGIRLLAKHKSFSHSTTGSRPRQTNRGAGGRRWGPHMATAGPHPTDTRLPALALPPGAGEVLLVLMTNWKSKPQRNFRVKAKPFKGKTQSPSGFSTILSRPGCFLVFPPMHRAERAKVQACWNQAGDANVQRGP